MRLKKIVHAEMLVESDVLVEQIIIHFQARGISACLNLPLPDGWNDLSREERIDWARQQINEHLLANDYMPFVGDVIWPDGTVSEDAVDDFGQLPGWATWTGQEAAQWIEDNVTTLASAKDVLKLMARAIVYLRDMVLER